MEYIIDLSKKLIGKWGNYTAYLVDDEVVRKKTDSKEFRRYGLNTGKKGVPSVNFKFIPEKEIWIAKSAKIQERHCLIGTALSYIRGIERRFSSDIAYEIAVSCEKSIKEKDTLNKAQLKKNSSFKNPFHIDVPEKVYYRIYTTVKDNYEVVKIYLVNREIVRNLYNSRFAEGGHGYVYEWIPKDEVWIDNLMKPKEIPIMILYEYVERAIIKYKNIPYDKAQIAASKVEFDLRNIINKKDAEKLSKDIVFGKLLKNIKF